MFRGGGQAINNFDVQNLLKFVLNEGAPGGGRNYAKFGKLHRCFKFERRSTVIQENKQTSCIAPARDFLFVLTFDSEGAEGAPLEERCLERGRLSGFFWAEVSRRET